jgi:hypothetical protein
MNDTVDAPYGAVDARQVGGVGRAVLTDGEGSNP